MKNTLLIVAILLAVVINGVLLYQLPSAVASCSPRGDDIQIAMQDRKPEPSAKKVKAEPAKVATGTVVTEDVVICYPLETRWTYKPRQPLRNVIRFFHNRKPIRNFIFRGRRW